ncbi:MAG: hypothetical protein PHH40_01635 [Candidatus Moranbacteria bacterium]|nr:hypothetical protein [Candidatus Moranbacteria bacterium]MDD3965078.1 hypothetical protein [Candidatus Moranbacteria bacterium]
MNTLEILKEAIKRRCSVSFEYNKQGQIGGERIGDPHAVFVFTAKLGAQSTKVDLFQTGGESDTTIEKPLPSWRFFNLNDISSVKILDNMPQFVQADGYLPESARYENPLAKI